MYRMYAVKWCVLNVETKAERPKLNLVDVVLVSPRISIMIAFNFLEHLRDPPCFCVCVQNLRRDRTNVWNPPGVNLAGVTEAVIRSRCGGLGELAYLPKVMI